MNIAIVSGASKGIGKECAKILDCKGLDQIWLIARNADELKKTAQTFKTKTRIFVYDLCLVNSLENILNSLNNEKPTVNYLVCSAGAGYNGAFETLTDSQISNMINLNVLALTRLSQIVLPFMKKKSKIIEIASGAGFLPQPYFSVYSATKSYVINFSRALRQELKKKKINVTAVCPGPVSTDFFNSLENVKDYKKKFLISPEKVAKGAFKASKRNKPVYCPTFSIGFVRFISKFVPVSFILSFYKNK